MESGSRQAKRTGERDERLLAVAAVRAPFRCTEAEHAALMQAEAITRLIDRPDPVQDDV